MDQKWLEQKLSQNGFNLQDLSGQTGIPLSVLETLDETNEETKVVWDMVLNTLNNYPAVRYPSADILDDLADDIQTYSADAQCEVDYGAGDGSLVFVGYLCLENGRWHGSSMPREYLSHMHLTLKEARRLFERQNNTISD